MSKPELTVIEGGLGQPAEAPPAELPPEQSEMPFAVVEGEPITQMPRDLYIPPDALQVFLEAFEGPLDLLLYLIRRQNLDIVDIPIAEITRQYLSYIDVMREMQLELAGEYLLMAATLAEIKSRMLLPRPQGQDGQEEDDPRAELVRRLQEYERYKKAAEDIDQLSRVERDNHPVVVPFEDRRSTAPAPSVSLQELLSVFTEVLARASLFSDHRVQREPLSVRERMAIVLDLARSDEFVDFRHFFKVEEGRAGVVVTLLAILELLKASMIEMVQNEMFGPIYVKAVG
jgi:segregation and condensation protein A